MRKPLTTHTAEQLEAITASTEEASAALRAVVARMNSYKVVQIEARNFQSMLDGLHHLRQFVTTASRSLDEKLHERGEFGNVVDK